MANEMLNEWFLERLWEGSSHWNFVMAGFTGRTAITTIDLSGADLSEFTDLSDINFAGVDLSGANLSGITLIGANLRRANLRDANLSGADLRGAECFGTNFSGANLRRADLESTSLNLAYFIDADLRGANLTHSQIIGTNFRGANLTGACIKDWHINADTCLEDITCCYVFTGDGDENGQFTGRSPHDLKQDFAEDEFTKRYQVVLDTTELFFDGGIDWKAFLASLDKLQAKYGAELSIRDIGRRAGGILLRLDTPPGVDKGILERETKEDYAAELKLVEAQHCAELQELGKQHMLELLAQERQHSIDLKEIVRPFAERPITVQLNAAQVHQTAVVEQTKEAKVDDKEKSRRNRIIALATAVGLAISGVVGWATDLSGKLKEFSEQWGIPIPGLVDSAQPDQSPSPPTTSP